MTPRKAILKELRAKGPDSYIQPAKIQGFGSDAPKYRAAVNDLLKDRLISGAKDAEGNLVVAINPDRTDDVNKALRSRFASPVVLGAVLIVVGAFIAMGALG